MSASAPSTSRVGASAGGASSTAAAGAAGAGQSDRTNVNDLTDVLGSAGVDLDAENNLMREENAGPSVSAKYGNGQQQSQNQHRTKQQTFLNQKTLTQKMQKIGGDANLSMLAPGAIAYIGLAAEARIRSLMIAALTASNHRRRSMHSSAVPLFHQNGEPMFHKVVTGSTDAVLGAFERLEREAEYKDRRERAERDLQAKEAAALKGGEDDTFDADGKLVKKTKKRKEAPISARNMPEDVQKRMSEQTALRFVAGKNYSWIESGGPGNKRIASPAGKGSAENDAAPLWNSGLKFDKVQAPRDSIEARDVLLALELECGLGAGEASGQLACRRRWGWENTS